MTKTTSTYRVQFPGSAEWIEIAGATPEAVATRAIYLHGQCRRHPRRVREVRPGCYRGLVGRVTSVTVLVRDI